MSKVITSEIAQLTAATTVVSLVISSKIAQPKSVGAAVKRHQRKVEKVIT